MESEPPVAPVAELQYQSDWRVRAADIIRLVAWWCIVIGAIGVANMALQLVTLYIYWGSVNLNFTAANGSIVVGTVIEVAKFTAAILLMVAAIRVLSGRIRLARSFWIILAALLAIEILSSGASLAFMWQRYGSADRVQLFSTLVRLASACAPTGILLTIVRSPEISTAIQELR